MRRKVLSDIDLQCLRHGPAGKKGVPRPVVVLALPETPQNVLLKTRFCPKTRSGPIRQGVTSDLQGRFVVMRNGSLDPRFRLLIP